MWRLLKGWDGLAQLCACNCGRGHLLSLDTEQEQEPAPVPTSKPHNRRPELAGCQSRKNRRFVVTAARVERSVSPGSPCRPARHIPGLPDPAAARLKVKAAGSSSSDPASAAQSNSPARVAEESSAAMRLQAGEEEEWQTVEKRQKTRRRRSVTSGGSEEPQRKTSDSSDPNIYFSSDEDGEDEVCPAPIAVPVIQRTPGPPAVCLVARARAEGFPLRDGGPGQGLPCGSCDGAVASLPGLLDRLRAGRPLRLAPRDNEMLRRVNEARWLHIHKVVPPPAAHEPGEATLRVSESETARAQAPTVPTLRPVQTLSLRPQPFRSSSQVPENSQKCAGESNNDKVEENKPTNPDEEKPEPTLVYVSHAAPTLTPVRNTGPHPAGSDVLDTAPTAGDPAEESEDSDDEEEEDEKTILMKEKIKKMSADLERMIAENEELEEKIRSEEKLEEEVPSFTNDSIVNIGSLCLNISVSLIFLDEKT